MSNIGLLEFLAMYAFPVSSSVKTSLVHFSHSVFFRSHSCTVEHVFHLFILSYCSLLFTQYTTQKLLS